VLTRRSRAERARPVSGYRCLRCDSWLPLPPPTRTARTHPPGRNQIVLPPRGKALRDKVVLRLIALDRALHFVLLALLALLVFAMASHRARLQRLVDRLNSTSTARTMGIRLPATPSSIRSNGW
jgi:hypothetical protein